MKFSIGEMSKLHNISVQTLRYYEKLGLLKPAYINEETGYRYYSIEQFIILDLIKHCKLMGLSLDEITNLMRTEITPSTLVSILEKQRQALDEKINELLAVRRHIGFLEERICMATKQPLNEIVIKEQEERKMIAYQYVSHNTEELEIHLRKVLLDVEKVHGMLNSEIAFKASYESVLENQLVYEQILLYVEEPERLKKKTILTLPAGTYLSLYYDDHYGDNLKYYQMLLAEAKKRGILLEGDFYEFSIMPKIDRGKKEKSLVELLIKVKE